MNKQDIQTVLDALKTSAHYLIGYSEHREAAITICEAALAEPSEPEPLRDDEVGDIARGMNIEITLNNEDTLLDFARAIESAVWERGFEMSIEYAQGWDDAKAQVTTDNSATLVNALAEIERLKPLAEVGRAMVEMTTTVHGADEWDAIPELWRMCMAERDTARADNNRKDAALQIALGALERAMECLDLGTPHTMQKVDNAITTIKEALA